MNKQPKSAARKGKKEPPLAGQRLGSVPLPCGRFSDFPRGLPVLLEMSPLQNKILRSTAIS